MWRIDVIKNGRQETNSSYRNLQDGIIHVGVR